jgi:hypothetical protein
MKSRNLLTTLTTVLCSGLKLRRLLVGLAALAIAGVASAQVTYTYRGNSFDSIANSGVGTPYTASDFVSGSFTVASALTNGSYSFTASTPSFSYSFSDGVYNFNSATDQLETSVDVTVASGAISSWAIVLETTNNNPISGLANMASYNLPGILVSDIGALYALNVPGDSTSGETGAFDFGRMDGNPGTWTVSPIPEPSTYAMLLSGLAVLGFVLRRNKENIPALAA